MPLRRLATLQQLAVEGSTRWQTLEVADWYDSQTPSVEYVSQTAVWYHTGKAPVAIRWVLVRWPLAG